MMEIRKKEINENLNEELNEKPDKKQNEKPDEKLNEKLKQKLKGREGESIVEVLVALLISAMALTMLAGMIVTSQRLIKRSEEVLRTYYGSENALEKFDSSGANASDASVSIFRVGEAGVAVAADTIPIDSGDSSAVKVYTGKSSIGNHTVASYKKA